MYVWSAAVRRVDSAARLGVLRLLIVAWALAAVLVVLPGRALATVPGSPGVPQAPATVFAEDFENGVSAAPVLLTGYTGASGETYTADPAWLTGCNGDILEFATPNSDQAASNCAMTTSFSAVRQMAWALGTFAGAADPTTNHAVTAYTEGNPGANKVQFQTVQPIQLLTSNRFLTFSVEATETNCYTNHAMFEFYLLNGSTAIPTFTTPIDPCTAGGTAITVPPVGVNAAGVYQTGNYAANGSVLFSGSSVGIRMINAQGSGAGNDAAFDNVRILDATPQLDKSFSPASVNVGRSSTLTFTVTNTSDLAAKDGWSFTDSLPAGLTIASPTNASTTCNGGSVTAPAGGTSVVVGGDLTAGQAACTASVDVTSSAAGTYTNAASNVAAVGLNPPGSSTVRFLAADVSIAKSASPSPAVPGTDETYTLDVRNHGPDAAQDVVVSDPLPEGLSFVSSTSGCGFTNRVVTCLVKSLAPGAAERFVVVARIASSVRSGIVNTATVTSGTPDLDPSNNSSTASAPIGPAADLALAKTASLGTVVAGGQVTYTLVVTNNGPSDADHATVSDPLAAGLRLVSATASQGSCSGAADVLCGLGTIAAGGSAQILVTAQVKPGFSGSIDNTASVVGGDPDPNHANNSASARIAVPPALPPPQLEPPQPVSDLKIAKTASRAHAYPGQQLTYTLRVRNRGPDTAASVRVTDTSTLAVKVLATHPSRGSCHIGRPLTCALGSLRADASATITVTAKVRRAGAEKNTATVTSASADPHPANNIASAKTKITPILRLQKRAAPRTVHAGHNIGYRLTVTNPTSVAIGNVTVCDTLPSELGYLSSNPKAHLNAGRYCWSIPKLKARARKTFTLLADAEPGKGGKLSNHATASAPGVRTAHASARVHMTPTHPVPCAIASQARISPTGRPNNRDPTAKIAC